MTFDPIKDGTLGAPSPKIRGVKILPRYTAIQNLKEIRQEMQLLQRTQQCEPKYNLWPYKRRNTGAALPRTIGVSILPRNTSIQNLKEIRQELQLLERTQECEPKYDLWPYKRRNTGGSITKNYSCVDLTIMHMCLTFERNPSRKCGLQSAHKISTKIWPLTLW